MLLLLDFAIFVNRTLTRTSMKYPIGIQDFQSLRQDGYLYIDKTGMVY